MPLNRIVKEQRLFLRHSSEEAHPIEVCGTVLHVSSGQQAGFVTVPAPVSPGTPMPAAPATITAAMWLARKNGRAA